MVSASEGDEKSRHERVMGRIARGGTLNLVGSLVAALLGFIQSIIIARGTSTTDAGIFFSATSATLILISVASFGADASLPRFIPSLKATGRASEIRPVIALSSIITLSLAILLGLVLVTGSGPIGRALSIGDSSATSRSLLTLLAVSLPMAALGMVWLAGTRAFLNMRATVLIDKVVKTILQVVLIFMAIQLGQVVSLVAAWLVPTAVLAVPALLWLRSIARRILPAQEGRGLRIQRVAALEYVAYSFPRALASILQMVLQRADIIIVAALLSPSQAAIYALATRWVVLGKFAANSLQQVVAPHLSGLIARDDWPTAMGVARTIAAWTVLLVWPLLLVSFSSGGQILDFLGGSQYSSGAAALAILAVGALLSSITGPVDTLLLMSGRSTLSLGITALAVALDLALLFVLVPQMGINGAAVAWSAALVVRAGLALLFVRRQTRTTTMGPQTLLAVVITLACFLALPLLLGLVFGGATPTTLLAIFACSVVYLSLLWVFREKLGGSALASLWKRRSAGAATSAESKKIPEDAQ